MQTAGDLVGILVELTAGMELGHDDLGGGNPFLGMDIHRNAAPVIGNRGRSVRVQGDRHQIAMPGQRLVDGVVHHLVDHVVQARAVVGVTDIHARPLPDRIKAAQDLDRLGAIFSVFAGHAVFFRKIILCHVGS